ncbi:hypothetical protein CDCA_CDCA02G0590 [Cyanidium caldarium]|uniref:Rab-GAP TBC domain-containing protein n=1 Tax=Cyanidium caldarium TaxID=2771 RepID=A0AAV9IR52_CYACA|nr:hypothetical protein CDCA_CDCA02G0590 [Cyanidium caldarium]
MEWEGGDITDQTCDATAAAEVDSARNTGTSRPLSIRGEGAVGTLGHLEAAFAEKDALLSGVWRRAWWAEDEGGHAVESERRDGATEVVPTRGRSTDRASAPTTTTTTPRQHGAAASSSDELGLLLETFRQWTWLPLRPAGDSPPPLLSTTVDTSLLRKRSWAGVQPAHRAIVWKLLLGYCPTRADRVARVLERQRDEYWRSAEELLSSAGRPPRPPSLPVSAEASASRRQIDMDVPRTSPAHRLFHTAEMQAAMKRILQLWSVRHPASGYVQGMNDILLPLLYVCYADHDPSRVQPHDQSLDAAGATALPLAEADAYWCLCALLSTVQDQYTFAQPGIQKRVRYLRDLIQRVDAPLCDHLDRCGIDFMQFSFRWMNCLLVREFPFPLVLRLWDAYLSEQGAFASFHVYVCAALVERFSATLQRLDFQEMVMFLQHLPTAEWNEDDVTMLLSQAYLWRSLFEGARRV